MQQRTHDWWKESVVYQVYPRSFQDSNGDGVGDLRGLLSRLDHLTDLGVDAVWLCPVYDSPNHDNGYDVRDYRRILAEFGTMEDMEALIEACTARGIRVLMDLVANHTSDECAWFLDSRSDRADPKRDWYLWKPGRDGGPPDDLVSIFGGSAWEYDAGTGEYYFHLFAKQQPDLNWENPEVRESVLEVMRFWLERGVAGFRMDAITYLKKDPALMRPDDGGPRLSGPAAAVCMNRPGVLDFLRQMKREAMAPYRAVSVAEAPGIPTDRLPEYIGERDGVFDMIFTFDHVDIDIAGLPKGERRTWTVRDFKRTFTMWQEAAAADGWLALFLENHDVVRSVSKFGDDRRHRTDSAKMLAVWYLMLRGTPFIYQGQELGMGNAPFDGIEEYRDIDARNYYAHALETGVSREAALDYLQARGRDHARTPMQWSAAPNAGFTTGTPWIRTNPDHVEVNVERESADPDSVLSFYRELIRLRRTTSAFVRGGFREVLAASDALGGYVRTLDGASFAVVCNFTPRAQRLPRDPDLDGRPLVLSSRKDSEAGALRPYEAVVLGPPPAG